ncbi:MAG: endonuclease/exonuclease/phosphatase family protein [Pirellulaceae bacterium]|nr:endonuclease/exonuclease/phosphatase family protein [Pirellulaceae bacterium]
MSRNDVAVLNEPSTAKSSIREIFRFAERGLLLAMGSVALGCWGLMIMRWFSDFNRALEIATHTSFHAFIACFAILILECAGALYRRRSMQVYPRWRRRLIFTLIPFLFFGWITEPWRLLPLRGAVQKQNSLKILSWNMLVGNQHFDEIVDMIREENPDVVVLVEFSPKADQSLQKLKVDYPYCSWIPSWQGSGMALLSRHPSSKFRTLYPGGLWMPAIELELDRGTSGGTLSLLAVHTLSPNVGDAKRTEIRDDQLMDIGRWARAKLGPAIAVGDFNVSPWSPSFWRLLEIGSLKDSSWYRGYLPSWPARFGRLGIPIDYALVSHDIEVLDRKNLYRDFHSDHIPILTTIR